MNSVSHSGIYVNNNLKKKNVKNEIARSVGTNINCLGERRMDGEE